MFVEVEVILLYIIASKHFFAQHDAVNFDQYHMYSYYMT